MFPMVLGENGQTLAWLWSFRIGDSDHVEVLELPDWKSLGPIGQFGQSASRFYLSGPQKGSSSRSPSPEIIKKESL